MATEEPERARRPRRRGLAQASNTPFVALNDSRQALAQRAYLTSLWGLIPGAGLLLGPLALGMALWYRYRERHNPNPSGRNLTNGAIFLGSLLLVTNWLGLALILVGLLQP